MKTNRKPAPRAHQPNQPNPYYVALLLDLAAGPKRDTILTTAPRLPQEAVKAFSPALPPQFSAVLPIGYDPCRTETFVPYLQSGACRKVFAAVQAARHADIRPPALPAQSLSTIHYPLSTDLPHCHEQK